MESVGSQRKRQPWPGLGFYMALSSGLKGRSRGGGAKGLSQGALRNEIANPCHFFSVNLVISCFRGPQSKRLRGE